MSSSDSDPPMSLSLGRGDAMLNDQSTPIRNQPHLYSSQSHTTGLMNRLNPPSQSPYTPVDLGTYLHPTDAKESTPTPSRLSPSHLHPMSTTNSPSVSPRPSPSPSPLPTLSELRNLQRANSAAGRLMAMKKLMGEDVSGHSLRRAGSLNTQRSVASGELAFGREGDRERADTGVDGDDDDGDTDADKDREKGIEVIIDQNTTDELYSFGQGMLGSPTRRTGARRLGGMGFDTFQSQSSSPVPLSFDSSPTPSPIPLSQPQNLPLPTPLPLTRPILGRSNTVGTATQEERRSVIGRRMMERLGNRVNQDHNRAGQGLTGLPGLGGLAQRARERKELREREESERERGRDDEILQPDLTLGNRGEDEEDEPIVLAPMVIIEPKLDSPTKPIELNEFEDLNRDVLTEEQDRASPFDRSQRSAYQTLGQGLRPGSSLQTRDIGFLSAHSHTPTLAHTAGQTIQPSGHLYSSTTDLNRSVSRATARSGVSDTFEYEAHLRRSGSEKRRGGTPGPGLDHTEREVEGDRDGGEREGDGRVVGDTTLEEILSGEEGESFETDESRDLPEEVQDDVQRVEGIGFGYNEERYERPEMDLERVGSLEEEEEEDYLTPPQAPFATTPSRYPKGRGKDSDSPSSIVSGMSAIPFILGPGPEMLDLNRSTRNVTATGPLARRDMSMSSFPAEIQSEGGSGGFQTPGRTDHSYYSPTSSGQARHRESREGSDYEMATPRFNRTRREGSEAFTPTHSRLGSAFHQDEGTEVDLRDPLDDGFSPGARSAMSWQDLGDSLASPIPTEHYPSKSQGVVKSIRDTFRRNRSRSASRSGDQNDVNSNSASRPGSPSRVSQSSLNSEYTRRSGLRTPTHGSRRESHKSDYLNSATGPHASMQSSVLSTAPSVVLPLGQVSPLPQIDPNDPRALDSKLSPFVPLSSHGPLLQQASDSVVPTLAANLQTSLSPSSSRGSEVRPEHPTAASYYDLAATGRDHAMHDDRSLGKKSWLAETFFTPNTATKRRPSISNILRRKGSVSQNSSRKNSLVQDQNAGSNWSVPTTSTVSDTSALEMEPYNVTAPLTLKPRKPTEATTAGRNEESALQAPSQNRPALSMVEEQVTPISAPAHARLFLVPQTIPPPTVTENQSPSVRTSYSRSASVVAHLDALLAMDSEDRPDVLDDPPRTLVASVPVKQLGDGQAWKDRHLFLFDDILIVAELHGKDPRVFDMDSMFSVRSLVPLQDLHINSTAAVDSQDSSDVASVVEHPYMLTFMEDFSRNGGEAIASLLDRFGIPLTPMNIASLLLKATELDKDQLGSYLSQPGQEAVLRKFLRRLQPRRIPLDSFIRFFLMTVRLPCTAVACKYMIRVVSQEWHAANASNLPFDSQTAEQLLISLMQLNDALHPDLVIGFGSPRPGFSFEDYVRIFREKDRDKTVSLEYLTSIFESIANLGLFQSMTAVQRRKSRRDAVLTIANGRSAIQTNSWSEPFFLKVPQVDANVSIELRGNGLEFDKTTLEFGSSNIQSFRVMSSKPGTKTVLISRVGPNAAAYANLPYALTVLVTTKPWLHTMNISCHTGTHQQQEYVFALPDKETNSMLHQAVNERIRSTRALKSHGVEGWMTSDAGSDYSESGLPPKARWAADLTAFKVLQSSLLANAHESQKTGSTTNDNDNTTQPASANDKPFTGKDLVLVCRQNSLLPIVLGLAGVANPPVSARIKNPLRQGIPF